MPPLQGFTPWGKRDCYRDTVPNQRYECRVAFPGDCLLVLMRLFFYELGFCLKLSEKSETLWKSGMNLTEIVQTIVYNKI